MAGRIERYDLISKEAIDELNNVLNRFEALINSAKELSQSLKGSGDGLKKHADYSKEAAKLTQELVKEQKSLMDLENKVIDQLKKKEQLEQNQLRTQKLRTQVSKQTTAEERQQIAMKKLLIQARQTEEGSLSRLNAVNNIYRQRMKELNVLIPVQAKQYERLTQSIAANNQRMVQMSTVASQGGKQFNMLQWQIMQVSRELPAFAYGLNVGIVALSNNLPMLFDEITKVRKANELLASQGKATVPVLKQIAASIFTWQTALVAVITLVTVFGRDIAEWTQRTINAKKALDDLYNTTKRLNDITVDTVKNSQEERYELTLLYKAATDVNLSSKDRNIAIDELNDKYPELLKNLSDEEILTGTANDRYNELIKTIFARAQAEAVLSTVIANNIKMMDLQSQKLAIIQKETQQGGGFWDWLIDKNEWREWFGTTSKDVQEEIDRIIQLNRDLEDSFDISAYLSKYKKQSTAEKGRTNDILAVRRAEMEMYIARDQEAIKAAERAGLISEQLQLEVDSLEYKKKGLMVLTQFTEKNSKEYYDILAELADTEVELAERKYELLKKIDDNYTKARIDDIKTWNEERISAIYEETNLLNIERQKQATQELLDSEKTQSKKKAINLKATVDILQNEYNAQQKILELENLSAEQKAQALQRMADLEVALQDKVRNGVVDLENTKREEIERTLQFISDTTNQIFDIQAQLNDNALQRAQNRYEREIQLAGDSEDKKLSAQRKFEAEQRKIQKRQAIAEKAQAAFNIGLNTAQAIMGIWAQVPKFDFGISAATLTAIVGALGAAQLAAVLSKPLPFFEKGTDSAPAAFVAGESGTEAIIKPSGEVFLTPNRATVFNDKSLVGSTIIPHEETMKMIAQNALNQTSDMIDMSQTNNYLKDIRDRDSVTYNNGYKIVKRKNFTGRYRV